MVPVVASKTYTGETLVADVSDTEDYEVVRNSGGIEVGDYEVELALKDNEKTWAVYGGSTNIVLTFTIVAAAPSNPNPANYATVDTHTSTLKTWLAKSSTEKFFDYTTTGTAPRLALGDDYKTNGIVRLSWSGTSGSCTVTVKRLSDGYEQTFTTSEGFVDLLAPEIGRNYQWTVTNGGSSSTWYFYTDGTAPRIIPEQLGKIGNLRDMGGWVTADGQYRVRHGLGFRCDHNADFRSYSQLKPFWTDIVGVKTDMDLRDKLGSSNYYCLWELDQNDSPGRSPYGEHWWDVLYWNVLREGDYCNKMEAYSGLINASASNLGYGSADAFQQFADAARLPIVVHCSQGRDRTGSLCFVLLGALGVSLNDLYTDWAMTDYAAPKDFPLTANDSGGKEVIALYNALKTKYPDASYPTLQQKCEEFLKYMGISDAQITNLKSYMLEPIEPKLSAAPAKTSVTVPSLSKTRVTKTGSVQKPTVPSNAQYTVDFGGGAYVDYGKYLVTVTLTDPANYQWADGTFGPKVLPFIIEHTYNVFSGNVRSFIQGDTAPKIMIARPRYQGQVSCNYTEEQLNNLAPGTYTASITAHECELATSANTKTCRFTVYPATVKATYTYEYANLNNAYFKTDYVPAISTDKVEVRMMDQTPDEGYAPFSCGPYPASMTIMKMSSGVLRYNQGAQRTDLSNLSWATDKIYTLTVQGKTITHKDEAANITKSASFTGTDLATPTPGTAFIGCSVDKSADRGAEGTPGYHQPHRLYHVKIRANGTTLTHEFVPCQTTAGVAMLYDKNTEKIYPFSHVVDKTGTVTLGGTATAVETDDPTPPDPLDYGDPDPAACTYTWKGYTGPWAYTTNWTASAGATYGIPNNATYATADFPASLAGAFTATVSANASVKFANFNSPNMTLKLDNASLTVANAEMAATYDAYFFTPAADADSMLDLSGANAALILSRAMTRYYFGYTADATSATGDVAIKFTVPAANWGTVPLRIAGYDSKFYIGYNVKFVVDATALGVPAEGAPVTVPLVSTTDGIRACDGDPAGYASAATVICASGAVGTVAISGNNLVLTVSAAPVPTELALVAPTNGATDVSVVRAGHTAFFALDRDARWAAVDNAAYRDAMVETASFPQEVAFSWQGGLAPFSFTLKRTRDNQVVKTVSGLTAATVSVGNLETGRAYSWQVTDAANSTVSNAFTTAYADQRFLKVGASSAATVVQQYSSQKSATIHTNTIPNFRDLGGMFAADGTKRVKQNVIFRSFCFDKPGSAGYESLGADLALLTGELGIRTDLDLRNQNETANVLAHGASPLGAGVAWTNCQMSAYDADSLGDAEEQALRVFLDTSKLPLVFHCTAGQDRTGTLAMLLGAILDLDEEDIEKGWSASCFFQNGMDLPADEGFQTHRIKRFFGSYAKFGAPCDTFAACVRNAIKAKTSLTDADFATIRANLLETDSEVTRPIKATADVPDPNAIERKYDGFAQTTYLRSNERYTVSMTDDAVNPGNYEVTLSLVDPTVCRWYDDSTQDKTVQFTITGDIPPEPIIETGSEGGAAIEIRDGSFNVRITNAVRGYRYGYRKATSLTGPWSDIIPLGGVHDSDVSEKVLSIPVEITEPSSFYKIVVWE